MLIHLPMLKIPHHFRCVVIRRNSEAVRCKQNLSKSRSLGCYVSFSCARCFVVPFIGYYPSFMISIFSVFLFINHVIRQTRKRNLSAHPNLGCLCSAVHCDLSMLTITINNWLFLCFSLIFTAYIQCLYFVKYLV